ncbi:MAG: trypsin-like peptidase domain-containing protein [Saprospiraceae bacterium]|nr:trypsin-like peptidase domain-containing protein [Saprospiraceae bacterium]
MGFTLRISLLILVLFYAKSTFSQVFTRVLTDDKQQIEQINTWHIKEEPTPYELPEIDFDKVLEDDKKAGKKLERFGVKQNTAFTVADGQFYQYGDWLIWKIGFNAKNAKSLNFVFSNFSLPKEAQMFIYGMNERMIIGPIEQQHIVIKKYSTDLIFDKKVFIEVMLPKSKRQEFTLTIEGIVHGIIKKGLTLRGYGDANDCNLDVNCAVGNGWHNERDAVAFIIVNNVDRCTGSLINNQCQDLTPNFLTAFHCLDVSPPDNSLNSTEQDVSNWVFRFNWETSSPNCPGSSGPAPSTYITFSGATFLAAHQPTDFALLRLNSNILDQPTLALAGWNRDANVPTQVVTAIHHAAGDLKKIAQDNEPLGTGNPNLWLINQWDIGLVEFVSSGSPLFDNNRRIIGQLKGGTNNIGCNPNGTSFVDNNTYGRFSVSWAGGGTNTTRLSDWLAGGTPPISVNTVRIPSINNGGSNYVCSANKAFTLNNPIPGRTVTWSVSPAYLFATSGGAAIYGSGANATLRASNSSSSGTATLTFTLTASGCSPVTLNRTIWVGIPETPTTSPSGTSTINMGVDDIRKIYLSTANGASAFTASWSASGAVSRLGLGNATLAEFRGDYEGNGNYSVTTSNVCGNA